ncbi:DeoR/GlpR family DNA-binding transcription regulator [Falsiroseomonas sp.]|uniref:DeoR/GlpR family DNA-binding transcription regulator n=1 Tax=Falsiroseomonas sp. TaxID=2870721 RepID=UPI003567020C
MPPEAVPGPDPALAPRQAALLRLVGEQGFGTVEGLARRFGVSTQTVRRDIIALTARGLLQRFHGGAGPAGAVRLGHAEKAERQREAKARIGAAAAARIPPGASLFLDVGTTAEALAVALAARSDLRVFTNNMQAALRLAGPDGPAVRVLGGTLRGADGSLVGGEAVRTLGGLALDIAVIACSGFDGTGAPCDFDAEKIALKRAAIAAARQAMLLADSSKFGRAALERIASLHAFAVLVTDDAPRGALAEALPPTSLAIARSTDAGSP